VKKDLLMLGLWVVFLLVTFLVQSEKSSYPQQNGVGVGYIVLKPTKVAALPPATPQNAGTLTVVSDSFLSEAEGRPCVGGGNTTALALSTGSQWKCF
jgi:hypothetical protein